MKSTKSNLLVVIFSLFSILTFSQELEEEKTGIIEQRVDFLLDINEGGETDFTTLFEQLELFYDRPINLNTATKNELEELGLLNQIQINRLIEHIDKNGKLLAFEELQSIEGFDLESIQLIRPFTKAGGQNDRISISPKNIFREGSSSFFMRYTRILEEQVGFSNISDEELQENQNARYLGSPDKLFSRYKFSYANNLSFGFTAEKDAGEEFFRGSQKSGFDFYSAHLFAQGFGTVKQLAIGDFQAQFGQGLTFWSGLAFERTPSIFTLKRNAPKLRPYTSVQEDLFLRGGGITLEKNQFELTLFYSSQNVDANISAFDTLSNEIIISSLSEDGFHRTVGELEDKNVILNTFMGGNLSYEGKKVSVGFTTVYNKIDADFQPRISTYNQFNRLDDENMNVGMDFNYIYKNTNLFGEVSHSIEGGNAYTVGALIALDARLAIAIQSRNFQRDFTPIQSSAIGESSTNSNEKGTFIGIEAKLSRAFSLSAYADRFVFEWLRFQTDAPSEGHRILTQINYKPSKKLEAYFRYRKRSRARNDNQNEEGIDAILLENTNNYRLHLSYKVSHTITLKNRVEYSNYQLGNYRTEEGILIYQDINYRKLGSPLSFSVRYALFDTDGFNSRIYAYENDVLYAFSVPAYNGRGSRFYISSKYHFSRNIDLWLRYAETYYTDRTLIGSGKDAINGNTKSEIKVQLRLKF